MNFRISNLFKKAIEENTYVDLWEENNQYNIITLCGSTKFKDDFEYWNSRLTLQGNIVFSCGVFGHTDDIVIDEERKQLLDDIHKSKIDLSNEIFVVNTNNYIGESTRNEIEYAISQNKPVRYASDYYVNNLIKDNGFL